MYNSINICHERQIADFRESKRVREEKNRRGRKKQKEIHDKILMYKYIFLQHIFHQEFSSLSIKQTNRATR